MSSPKIFAAFLAIAVAAQAIAQTLPQFDFTQSSIATEWRNQHHISSLQSAAEGLEITINGDDPYFFGPARDYPTNTPLWMNIRFRSDEAGSGEVFYFRNSPEADKSVRFSAPAGQWTEARVPMPSLGAGFRLRIDPPGHSGKMVLASVRFEKRVNLGSPTWPAWAAPRVGKEVIVKSGAIELVRTADPLAFEVRVDGASMAFTHPRPRVAYVLDEQVRWVDLASGSIRHARAETNAAIIESRTKDTNGGEWIYRQTFRVNSPGTIATETSVSVDRERTVAFMPMHLFFAGEGSFGRTKGQGIFPGLEYLDNEPSSSEADIVGPESNRRVPSSHKITIPLMAIQANDRYVGLIWESTQTFAALFDSPDRTFGSGGHAMGVIFPGSNGANREEGSVLPYYGEVLKANTPLLSRAWIVGGAGKSIVPAVQHFVNVRGWPGLPQTDLALNDYVKLATHGWLDSKCRETNLYRHAVWPGFKPQPAADAALYETWLATQTTDQADSTRLRDAARDALSVVRPESYYHSAVSHVRAPVMPLVFGSVRGAAEAARQTARGYLGRFSADNAIPYRAAKSTDYGKTHFAPDANGLTAQVVASLLEAAAFCGDRELIAQAIVKLRGLDKFRNTVPRGAQTWEMPLHTPDILASAHLVRAYTLGYQLTGERAFLDDAIYWAWTGVPFVYFVNPTDQKIGPYSTIAVLGATSWKAPIWFGQPVQWCGLVYADALYQLAPHDNNGPWKKLADGITIAGIQLTWPTSDRDRGGLLPDYFELKPQLRSGPAINPGTVGSCAVRLYTHNPLYDFSVARSGLLIHAPGRIVIQADDERRAEFTVLGWPREDYFLLINGVRAQPRVKVNGSVFRDGYDAGESRLILKVAGQPRVEITW